MNHSPPRTRYGVDPADGFVRVELEGLYDLPQFIGAIAGVVETPGYRQGMSGLWDARRARMSFDGDAVRSLTQYVQDGIERWGTDWRIALVAADDLTYGLGRMTLPWFDGLPFEARIFRDYEAAEAWVRMPRALREPPESGASAAG